MAPPGKVRATVLAAAVGVSLVGAVIWSNRATNATPDAVLDVPGEYQEPTGSTNPPLPTDRLPALTLSDAAGQPVELRSDGRPMVVNLWFSTCAPCAKELADFAQVDADLGDKVRFIGVDPFDTPAAMTKFAAARGVTYELLRDPDESLGQALDVVAYPVTLLVAADGTILDATGPMTGDVLRARLEVLFPVNLGLSFLRGMVATVNPCGFVLLPTYLMYFLGLEASRASPGASERPGSAGRSDTERATVRRALLVGGAVTGGFMAVFVVVGAVTSWFTSWMVANSKYVTGIAGAVFVVLGVAMLFGFKPSFAAPGLSSVGQRDRTVRSMFVYGVVYAVVSLSCTLVLFIPLLFDRDGWGAGVVNGAAFALGMGLLVTALTVSLAVANHALLRVLRSAMQHIQLLAAAFLLLSGVYLLYYFWVVDVNEDSGALTDAVERFQVRITTSLNDNWRIVAIVLAAIVIAAITYVGLRRRPVAGPPVGSPTREPEPEHTP